jgi:hypothetical protein
MNSLENVIPRYYWAGRKLTFLIAQCTKNTGPHKILKINSLFYQEIKEKGDCSFCSLYMYTFLQCNMYVLYHQKLYTYILFKIKYFDAWIKKKFIYLLITITVISFLLLYIWK